MSELQRRIFARLANVVRTNGLEHYATSKLDEPRFIRGDEADADAIKHASVRRLEQFQGIGPVAVFRWKSAYYMSVPSTVRVDVDDLEYLDSEIKNAGLASLVFVDEEVEPDLKSAHEMVDEVFGRAGSYELKEIEGFFAVQRFYKLRDDLSTCKEAEIWSMAMAVFARGIAQSSPPKWVIPVLDDFIKACTDASSRFAGEHLVLAIRAGTWNHGYLEIFRSIEALFRVMCIEDFVSDFPDQLSSEPRGKILKAIDEHLMWRMREDQALERLCSRIDESYMFSVNSCLSLENKQQSVRRLYATRNRIAHGALFGSKIEDRDKLMKACLIFLRGAYAHVNLGDWWIPKDSALVASRSLVIQQVCFLVSHGSLAVS